MENLFCSGGEAKDLFWRMVLISTKLLPKNKPRYVMGVGFAVDIIVCCALGADMFDCVFPTRTAVSGGVRGIVLNEDFIFARFKVNYQSVDIFIF